MPIVITFASKDNKEHYKKTVLTWLKNDFYENNEPKQHFWFNKDTISDAFDKCKALVALDSSNQNALAGYMIWSNYDGAAEIDIVEVKKPYRRQGIFKRMLSAFSEKFPNISVLTATVIEESQEKFTHAGWKNTQVLNNQKKFYKIIDPGQEVFNTLQDGCGIAICSEDFYEVKKNRDQYKSVMKFFRIYLDKDKRLHKPIVTEFTRSIGGYDGYIGIYFNQQLLAEGKAKYLFKSDVCHVNLFILDKFIPTDPNLFKEFIEQAQRDNEKLVTTTDKELFSPLTKQTKKPAISAQSDFFTTPKKDNAAIPAALLLNQFDYSITEPSAKRAKIITETNSDNETSNPSLGEVAQSNNRIENNL